MALLFLGFMGLLWVSTSSRTLILAVSAREITRSTLAGDGFRPETLKLALMGIEDQVDKVPIRADIRRAVALIHFAMLDATQPDRLNEVDPVLIQDTIRLSLMQSPTDSYLWFLLYSVANLESGFDKGSLKFLYQSYKLAPTEGWIAMRRNKRALAVLLELDKQTQEKVISEFAAMIGSEFFEQATQNLTGVGWAHKERLLESLRQVDAAAREMFAKRLVYFGVKATVPGVNSDTPGAR